MYMTRKNGIILTVAVGVSFILLFGFVKQINILPLIFILALAWPIFSYNLASKMEVNSNRIKSLYFVLFFSMLYIVLNIATIHLAVTHNQNVVITFDSLNKFMSSLYYNGLMVFTMLAIMIMIGYIFIFVEEDTHKYTVSRVIVLFAYITAIINFIEFMMVLLRYTVFI